MLTNIWKRQKIFHLRIKTLPETCCQALSTGLKHNNPLNRPLSKQLSGSFTAYQLAQLFD